MPKHKNDILQGTLLLLVLKTLSAQVLGEAGRIAGAGVVLGGLLALAVTRPLASFLYGVGASDPATLAVAASTLALVALASGALPAWRAARVDPMGTLREDWARLQAAVARLT